MNFLLLYYSTIVIVTQSQAHSTPYDAIPAVLARKFRIRIVLWQIEKKAKKKSDDIQLAEDCKDDMHTICVNKSLNISALCTIRTR